MRLIPLDASKWQTADDVYSDLLAALEAPEWHGRNLNALWDSVTEAAAYADLSDFIIGVRPPFRIEVSNAQAASSEARKLLSQIEKLLADARAEYAIDVSMAVQPFA